MNHSRTHTLVIRTPEGIMFSQTLAGPVSRCLAWAVDLACVGAILMVLRAALGLLGLVSADLLRTLSVLVGFAVTIGYSIALEWGWRGQTIGKRLLRLRVVDAQGLRLQFNQIVIRNLLRFVDALPLLYLFGGLTCLLNKRSQRLGDIAANTVVIRTPKFTEPDLDQILAGKYNSFRDHPHLAARLRQHVSPAEARIALQALVRRGHVEPAARVELFAELAAHFRTRAEFPPDITEGITDEQYVRNTVDILYRTRTSETPAQQPAAA